MISSIALLDSWSESRFVDGGISINELNWWEYPLILSPVVDSTLFGCYRLIDSVIQPACWVELFNILSLADQHNLRVDETSE